MPDAAGLPTAEETAAALASIRGLEDPGDRQQAQEKMEQDAARAAAPTSPGAAAPAAPALPATTEQLTAEIDAIERKVNLGQDLTAEEQKRLDDLEKVVPEPAPDIKYRIAGQELTYAEAAQRWRTETGIGNLDISRDAEQKNVETWVIAQNKSEQSKAAEQRSQTAATQEKVVSEREIVDAQRAISEAGRAVDSRMQDMESHKRELANIAEELQYQQGLAARRPTPMEIENGLDFRRQSDLLRADDADMRIERLRQKEAQYNQLLAEDQAKIEAARQDAKVADERANFLEILDFVTTTARELIPRSCNLKDAIGKYFHKEELPDDDWERINNLVGILGECELHDQPLAKVYMSRKRNGQITVKGVQTSQTVRGLPTPTNKAAETINRIQKLRERASAAPARLPTGLRGSTAGPGGVLSPQDAARKHLESERAAATLIPGAVDFDGKITNPQRRAGDGA